MRPVFDDATNLKCQMNQGFSLSRSSAFEVCCRPLGGPHRAFHTEVLLRVLLGEASFGSVVWWAADGEGGF